MAASFVTGGAKGEMVMKCPNCGTENDEDAVFCKKCGAKIEAQSDSEDISWVDKVDFTKGIDWGEPEDPPERKTEEPAIEVDLSQKQRAQMWENLQRKKAEQRQTEEVDADQTKQGNADKENLKKKRTKNAGETEAGRIAGGNRKRPETKGRTALADMDDSKDADVSDDANVSYDANAIYDDDGDDFDFDEYDYQDEDGSDGGKPPIGIFVGIIGIVAAIVVLAIVLFNVFSNGNKGYVPATRPAEGSSASAGDITVSESAPMDTTEAPGTTADTAEQTVEETTYPETAEETTEEATTVEETTVPETTVPETTMEQTTEPDPEPVVQDGLTYHFHGEEAYVGKYTGDAAEIYVASEVNGYPVRYIDADAFSDCYSLQKLYLPEGVVEIGENALYNCTSLSQIVLPSTLTKIGQGAFDYCPAFTIVGQEGTYAQQFADTYHVNFVSGSDFTE